MFCNFTQLLTDLLCSLLYISSWCQASLGTHHYLTHVTHTVSGDWGWVPLACVIGVNAFRTVGFMVVIQLVLAESFPTEIRSN